MPSRRQGSLAEVSSIDLAADVTARALAERRVALARIVGLRGRLTLPGGAHRARGLSGSVDVLAGTDDAPHQRPHW